MMQPIERDDDGILRFKVNTVVEFLLDWASDRGVDMNALAILPFSDEDRRQFAQLIGYSVIGYCELPYVDDAAAGEAIAAADAFSD